MGQKVHPIGFRLGFNKVWDSLWFSKKNYRRFLKEDIELRRMISEFITKKHGNAGISKIIIERPTEGRIKIVINAARPGLIVGKKYGGLDELKSEVIKKCNADVIINVLEVRRVDIDPYLIAENIASQLIKRVNYRRAMKKAVTAALRSQAKGVKIACSGRLGGAEIARTEWYREGRVPLHTLKADIEYGFSEAKTIYGTIGIKVWIYKGETD